MMVFIYQLSVEPSPWIPVSTCMQIFLVIILDHIFCIEWNTSTVYECVNNSDLLELSR